MKKLLLALWIWFILITPIRSQGPIYLPLITKDNSCMGIAKLAISDGTTEISLLDLEGIHLAEDGWTPKIIQAKGGGVFQDSSMAAGRRLVYRQLGTAREDFTFNIMGITQDELIAETSDLLQMLEKAVNYWATTWQSNIVYLIAQSDCETYARYAPILYYEAPELQNPYGQPFVQAGNGAIFDDIGIMIERGHWQDVAPGSSSCTESSSTQTWAYQGGWEIESALPVNSYSLIQIASGRILAGDNAVGNQILNSDDGGYTWAVLFAGAPIVATITDFIQTPTGRIFAGDSGQIIYSDNNGAAWAVSTAAPVNVVSSLLQTNTGRIIAGENSQMWYSDNNGAAWAVLTTVPLSDVTDLIQTTSGRILATDLEQILYSDDDGNNWAVSLSTFLGFSPPYSILETSTGRILLGDFTGVLWYSDDDGDPGTWHQLGHDFGNTIASMIQIDTGEIFLSIAGIGTWYSEDDGVSWTEFVILNNGFNDMLETTGGPVLGSRADIYLYDDTTITMGRDDSCLDEVFVANKNNIANLTDIYIDDGGVFGSNLLPMTVFSVDLLPAVPVVNDAIYFGISTANENGGPFCSLVFDLDDIITLTSSYTITWEYRGAGAWNALTVHDGTDLGGGVFRQPDVRSVHWIPPSDWTAYDLSGAGGPAITGYWVRARVSALAGTITPPSQQNRNIYTVVHGYADVDDADISGDISALAQIRPHLRSDEDGRSGDAPDLYENRVIVGLRSYDRGALFQAYLNISDEQYPFGIEVTAGTNTTIAADIVAPTGQSTTYNPAGVEAMATRATITFDPTIAQDYYGTYHAFLRVQRTAGASTDFDVQLVVVTGSGGIQKTTESKQVKTTTAFELLDFNQITIPAGGSLNASDLGDQFQILIQASAASGTPNLIFYDLILIPVDEWAIDSIDQTNSSNSIIGRDDGVDKLLDIDSVTDPKNPIKSLVRRVGNEFVSANYNPIANGPAILQANVDQRLWFLAAQTSATGSSYSWISRPEMTHSLQLFRAQRYLGLRGAR